MVQKDSSHSADHQTQAQSHHQQEKNPLDTKPQAQPTEKTAKKRAPLIVLTTCAIVALICGVILFTTSDSGSQTSDSASSTRATSAQTDSTSASDQGAASASREADQYAPRQTDPGLIKFLAQLTRKDPKDPRAIGKVDAPVTMLEFSDFSCPMCFRFELATLPELKKLVDQGILRIEHHNHIIFDQQFHSALGAQAAYAAGLQGKFWEFTQASAQLSQSQSQQGQDSHVTWDKNVALQVAKQAQVPDLTKFQSDLQSKSVIEAVQKDAETSARLGIEGTPAFFINDRFLNGAQPTEIFQAVIEGAKHDR